MGASPEQRTGHQIDEADAAFVFVDQVVTGTVVEAIVEREAKGRVVTGRVLDRDRWDSIRSVLQAANRPISVDDPTTSAAWMMVFRRAGAIVADTASVLSRTAIVAREFALPAVVAAANATSSLVDGEEVTVDGSRGVVTRC